MSFRLALVCCSFLWLVGIANASSNATFLVASNIDLNDVISLEANGVNVEQLNYEKVDQVDYAFQIFPTINSLLQTGTPHSGIASSHLTHRLCPRTRAPPYYYGNSVFRKS